MTAAPQWRDIQISADEAPILMAAVGARRWIGPAHHEFYNRLVKAASSGVGFTFFAWEQPRLLAEKNRFPQQQEN
jgi:hypothetical protein